MLVVTIGTGLGTALFSDGHLLPNTELGHIMLDNGLVAERYASKPCATPSSSNGKTGAIDSTVTW